MEEAQETGQKKNLGANLVKLHGNMGLKMEQHMLEVMLVIIMISLHLEMYI